MLLYESESLTVWQGDSRDVLSGVRTESADLIVTDPPYGMEWQSNSRADPFDQLHGAGADADERVIISDILEQCVRVVRQKRHLYVFVPADVLEGQKVSEVAELAWDKGVIGAGDVSAPWGARHERISFCVSMHRHGGKNGTSGLPTRMRKGSVLTFMRPTGRTIKHPTSKLWQLMRS